MKPPIALLAPEEGQKIIEDLLRKHGEAEGRICLPNDLPPPEAAVEFDSPELFKTLKDVGKEGLDYHANIDTIVAPPGAWVILHVKWAGLPEVVLPFQVARNRQFLSLLAANRRLWIYEKGRRNGELVSGTVLEEVPDTNLIQLTLLMTALFPPTEVATNG